MEPEGNPEVCGGREKSQVRYPGIDDAFSPEKSADDTTALKNTVLNWDM